MGDWDNLDAFGIGEAGEVLNQEATTWPITEGEFIVQLSFGQLAILTTVQITLSLMKRIAEMSNF